MRMFFVCLFVVSLSGCVTTKVDRKTGREITITEPVVTTVVVDRPVYTTTPVYINPVPRVVVEPVYINGGHHHHRPGYSEQWLRNNHSRQVQTWQVEQAYRDSYRRQVMRNPGFYGQPCPPRGGYRHR